MKVKEILQVAIVLIIVVFLANVSVPFVSGSEKPLIVLSGSMAPMMLPGDMIVVKTIDSSELEVGDVIAFHPPESKPNTLVTHRIVSFKEGEERLFQTKGDANNVKDDFKVPAANIVGKLIFVIPFAGYLPEISKHNNFIILTVILPASLIIIDEIKNLIIYSSPIRARRVEREKRKTARRTSYSVKRNSLAATILMSGLVFTLIVTSNMGENGSAVLKKENQIMNQQGFLPLVYVFTPENFEQKLSIDKWYGIVSPANVSRVTAPENTHAKISSVPYILPIFWIISLAAISPYLPAIAVIVAYTSVFTLLLLPLWYRKSTIGRRKKRMKFKRLFARWKRTLKT